MKVGSLFSGIGGFDEAFRRAGMTVTAQVEINPKCQQVLARHFPNTTIHNDVTEVTSDQLGPVDLICGGFPCQDVSIAGLGKGLAGSRSGLWWEFARILYDCRPRWCVIENVPGLLSSNGGRDMGAVLGHLANVGYGFAYRVLDAQWFGLAQHRKRVFIVGCLGDRRAPTRVLFEPESSGGDLEARGEAGEVASALTRCGLGGGGPDDNLAQAGHLIAGALTGQGPGDLDDAAIGGNQVIVAQCHGSNVGPMGTLRSGGSVGSGVPFTTMPLYYSHDYNQDRVYDPAGLAEAVTVARRPKYAVGFHATQDPISTAEQSPALGANALCGVETGTFVRTLTPVECERFQGFPDGWTAGQSKTTRYRQLGNAVAVPVAEWVGRRIMEQAT